MKFCFWQNIVSIHQAPFLEALAKKHEVVLRVEEQLIESRAKEGWNVPEIFGVSISGIPSGKELTTAFADKEIHHIFSGIDAFPGVYRAFRCAVDSRSSISVFLEPYVWRALLSPERFSGRQDISVGIFHSRRWPDSRQSDSQCPSVSHFCRKP